MTDETNKQGERKENSIEIVTVYEARLSRDAELDERVFDHSDGYFHNYEDADAAVRKHESELRYYDGNVKAVEVIKVAGKHYRYSCCEGTVEVVEPSQLENIGERTVALNIRDKKIALIYSTPIEVK